MRRAGRRSDQMKMATECNYVWRNTSSVDVNSVENNVAKQLENMGDKHTLAVIEANNSVT